MAAEPMPAGPSVLAFEISLEPTAGDPFSHVSSPADAALSIAALRERVSPDHAWVEHLADLQCSPSYHLARTSLERDLLLTDADLHLSTTERRARRSFALDIFAGRLYLAGRLSTHKLLRDCEVAA